jgi:hypothetical protein
MEAVLHIAVYSAAWNPPTRGQQKITLCPKPLPEFIVKQKCLSGKDSKSLMGQQLLLHPLTHRVRQVLSNKTKIRRQVRYSLWL